jgi:hypothetical protein
MRSRRFWGWAARAVSGLAALGGGMTLCGCGMPGAPQPPSLHLPAKVTDLSASRAGNEVLLTWTMPKRDTDKLLLKDAVGVHVCRKEPGAGVCVAVGSMQSVPGVDATFKETLPTELASGQPRGLTYFVELLNHKGRSAGLSNGGATLAGEAPPAVEGLSAEMRKDGVLLKWTPTSTETGPIVLRLERKLVMPGRAGTRSQQGPLAPPPEPAQRTLLVPAGGPPGEVVDKDIRFGESYEYRAQRVVQVTVDSLKLELAGPLSAPVPIDAENLFPPEVPRGLAAVATAGENGGPSAIDLSWQPDTEADLAGYIVYRREANGAWQRISPAQPVAGPGYHDPQVQPGHTYSYAVSAIDQEGHESARSVEALETVPEP